MRILQNDPRRADCRKAKHEPSALVDAKIMTNSQRNTEEEPCG